MNKNNFENVIIAIFTIVTMFLFSFVVNKDDVSSNNNLKILEKYRNKLLMLVYDKSYLTNNLNMYDGICVIKENDNINKVLIECPRTRPYFINNYIPEEYSEYGPKTRDISDTTVSNICNNLVKCIFEMGKMGLVYNGIDTIYYKNNGEEIIVPNGIKYYIDNDNDDVMIYDIIIIFRKLASFSKLPRKVHVFREYIERYSTGYLMYGNMNKYYIMSTMLNKWYSLSSIIVNLDTSVPKLYDFNKIQNVNGPLNIISYVLYNKEYGITKDMYLVSDALCDTYMYYENVQNVISTIELYDVMIKTNPRLNIDFYIEYDNYEDGNGVYLFTREVIDYFETNKRVHKTNYNLIDIRSYTYEIDGNYITYDVSKDIVDRFGEFNNVSGNLGRLIFTDIDVFKKYNVSTIYNKYNTESKQKLLNKIEEFFYFKFLEYTKSIKSNIVYIMDILLDYYAVLKLFSNDNVHTVYHGKYTHIIGILEFLKYISSEGSYSKLYGYDNIDKSITHVNDKNKNPSYYTMVNVSESKLPFFETDKPKRPKKIVNAFNSNDHEKLEKI